MKKEKITILGIESSCDETAASLLHIANGKLQIVSNVVSSQVKIHQQFGGIVPEVAARKHVEMIMPVIDQALGKKQIDLIAVTAGPGLITSLMVGTETAKVLSYLWQKPIVGINHLEGHIYSNWLSNLSLLTDKNVFPAVCLIVSGGHTELVLMKGHGQYQLLGRTRDDAAGEAFDKVAKILKIGYPGGPVISKHASQYDSQLAVRDSLIVLPRPMIDDGTFDFSFSGLKTAVLYEVQKKKKPFTKSYIQNLCYDFQQAVVEVLTTKTIKAAQEYGVQNIMLSGGVSANQKLRAEFKKLCRRQGINFYCPDLKYTGDNAAMIALAGYFDGKKAGKDNWSQISLQANWQIV